MKSKLNFFLRLLIYFLFCTLSLTTITKTIFAQSGSFIFISELMPNPIGVDTDYEWIELYNYGLSNIELANFKIDANTLPAFLLSPNSFVIVARNSTKLMEIYPTLTNVVQSNFSLTNTLDTVNLTDLSGNTIDGFSYSSSIEGRSIEKDGPICNNTANHPISESISAHNSNFNSSCFPVINPPEPLQINSFEISIDNVNFSNKIDTFAPINLYFRYTLNRNDAILNSVKFYLNDLEVSNPVSLIGNISKIASLEIIAEDQVLTASTDIINILNKLRINEVNLKTDESLGNWIEIYNPNNFDVEVNNYSILLNDTQMNFDDFEFKENFTNCGELSNLMANQYCLLFLQDQSEFENVEITLYNLENQIDLAALSFLTLNQSLSFFEGNFRDDMQVTPGTENVFPTISHSGIQISEAYPSPNTEEGEVEWIEFFNFSKTQNLKDWYLKDLSTTIHKFGDIQINSQSYIVVYEPDLKITLNNSGDTLFLYSPDNVLQDTFQYSSIESAKSAARIFSDDRYIIDYPNNLVPTTTILTPNAKNEFPQPSILDLISIKEAKEKIGQKVKINGIVTAPQNSIHNDYFYIQDNTSGIKVEAKFSIFINLNTGIELIGTISESNKEMKVIVNSVDDIFQKNLTFTINPYNIEGAIDRENLEGSYIEIVAPIVNNFGSTFDLSINGEIFRVSILNNLSFEKQKNDTVKILGIFSQYNDLYRILPRFQSDLMLIKRPTTTKTVTAKKATTTTTQKNTNTNANSILGKEKSTQFSSQVYDVILKKDFAEENSIEIMSWPIFASGGIGSLVLFLYFGGVVDFLFKKQNRSNSQSN